MSSLRRQRTLSSLYLTLLSWPGARPVLPGLWPTLILRVLPESDFWETLQFLWDIPTLTSVTSQALCVHSSVPWHSRSLPWLPLHVSAAHLIKRCGIWMRGLFPSCTCLSTERAMSTVSQGEFNPWVPIYPGLHTSPNLLCFSCLILLFHFHCHCPRPATVELHLTSPDLSVYNCDSKSCPVNYFWSQDTVFIQNPEEDLHFPLCQTLTPNSLLWVPSLWEGHWVPSSNILYNWHEKCIFSLKM